MMHIPKHIVAAGAWITDDDGKVLLMRHPRRGWEFPGGQVEEGEDLIEGLKREVEEETGIAISVGELVGVYSNLTPPVKVIFGFLGRRVSGTLRISSESPEVGWFPREEALAMITNPSVLQRAKDAVAFSGKIVYRVYATNPYQVYKEFSV